MHGLLRCRTLSLVATLAMSGGSAMAQQPLPIATFKNSADVSPDLKLPTEGQSPGMFMRAPALLKPEGSGPFPTLVVFHSCGGVRSEIFDWARRAVAQGYAALVIDSLGPRGLKTNCVPPNKVPTARGVKDAFQALDHLRTLPFVDKDRVGLIGFSWGAMVGALVSSKEISEALSPSGARYQAAVSLYPVCAFNGGPGFPNSFEFLRQDVDKPMLVLMGEEDTEGPPSECLPRLDKLKANNAPVEWNLYPGTTHCWDCESLNGFRKTDFQGHAVVYRYSREATEDSARRAFDFFARQLKNR